MKILHLRSAGGFYGAENVILHLASCRKDKVDAAVAAFTDDTLTNELLQRCEAAGIPAVPVRCNGLFDQRAVKQLKDYLRDHQIDILHTHGYKSTLIGCMAARGLPVKKAATNHLWDYINPKLWLYQRLEGLTYNFYDQVIAVSQPVYEDTRPWLFNKNKLRVIPNGIDYDLYACNGDGPRVRAALKVPRDSALIGLVGRLSPQKGHIFLIEAAGQLLNHTDNFKVAFWGHGPLEAELKARVKRYRLKDHVIFAGVTDDMPSVYKAVDMLAMPSLSEGLPMTMLEAMAAGVPVLATPVGDIPKVIKDNITGFLLPTQNSDLLAAKIKALMDDPAQAREIGQKGRDFVKTNFSSRAMGEKYLEVYEEVTGK
jgi:glycosyltransferase involved in cell wall biosynthesis